MKRACDDDGLCMISLVTLPATHSTPCHPPLQQLAPRHVERMPVASFKMLALKPRRAALSVLEQIGDDGVSLWNEGVVKSVVIRKILIRNCISRCGMREESESERDGNQFKT